MRRGTVRCQPDRFATTPSANANRMGLAHGNYPSPFLLELWRIRFAPIHRALGVFGCRLVLLGPKSPMGIDAAPSNSLAPLAKLRAPGCRVGSRASENLADTNSNILCKYCSL
jgi:hypothetical protein